METRQLQAIKEESPALDQLFTHYADCLLSQIFQSVACSAAHSIEQRTARWLLSAHDRTGDLAIPITQQRLAELLGVGRSYVSRVLAGLKSDNALKVSLGCIQILDRRRLDRHSCNCTRSVRAHFDKVLAQVYPPDKRS
nr:helix-turn-helix domain-containing protein [Polymorphobacter multimanifer]